MKESTMFNVIIFMMGLISFRIKKKKYSDRTQSIKDAFNRKLRLINVDATTTKL